MGEPAEKTIRIIDMNEAELKLLLRAAVRAGLSDDDTTSPVEPVREPVCEAVSNDDSEEWYRERDRERARHMYAVEIVDVGVKIGITNWPSKRLQQHAAAARRFGRHVGRAWTSIRHAEAVDSERSVIRWGGNGTEYISKPFDDVVAFISSLPMTPFPSHGNG